MHISIFNKIKIKIISKTIDNLEDLNRYLEIKHR